MNRSLQRLKLGIAIEGFLQYKTAEALSAATLYAHKDHLTVFANHIGEREVQNIPTADLRAYLAWMRSDYKPRRLGGSTAPLSSKTLRNIWVSLSAFFRWASTEFHFENPMKGVPAPKFKYPPVEAFTKEEIERLLKACEYSREAKTDARRKFVMRRPTANRDRALILMLVDTGLRAGELCSLQVGDLEQATGKVHVKHGRAGGAKGGKGRFVYLGKAARRAVWRYLAEREDGRDPEAPLFIGKFNRTLKRDVLLKLIERAGQRAGIGHCHPHRFRHTFAITYLRSGGDLFTLQALLGHRSLEMVQHYARIAQVDVQDAHRRASPADNWRL